MALKAKDSLSPTVPQRLSWIAAARKLEFAAFLRSLEAEPISGRKRSGSVLEERAARMDSEGQLERHSVRKEADDAVPAVRRRDT
jgi:hypothetical protein